MAFRHSKAKQSSILDYQDSECTDIKIIESVEAVTSHTKCDGKDFILFEKSFWHQ